MCRWKISLKLRLNAEHTLRKKDLCPITVCLNYRFHIQTQKITFPTWIAKNVECWLALQVISLTFNCAIMLFIWGFKQIYITSVDLSNYKKTCFLRITHFYILYFHIPYLQYTSLCFFFFFKKRWINDSPSCDIRVKRNCNIILTTVYWVQTKGPNMKTLMTKWRGGGSNSQGNPKMDWSNGVGWFLNPACEWHLKWDTAGATSCKETQKRGLCCTLSDGHRHNKTAGRISKGLHQCPAGFMFTHPTLWIFWQSLFKGLLMLDCSCQTELFFQIYVLNTDGLLLIEHDRHYIIRFQISWHLNIYIVLRHSHLERKLFLPNEWMLLLVFH